nr:MAG TPA: hypothetical protein [Caudoviricetes sp.]
MTPYAKIYTYSYYYFLVSPSNTVQPPQIIKHIINNIFTPFFI